MSEPIKTASEFMDWLFTNGRGEVADSLVLTKFHDTANPTMPDVQNLGGYSRSDVLSKVEEFAFQVRVEAVEKALINARLLDEEF